MQAAMAARNNSAGLKAHGRPLTSVSSLTSASLQRARLPCASVRFATTLYSSILAILGFDSPGSALHDSNAGGVLRCDGSIDGSNNRPAARENIGCQMSVHGVRRAKAALSSGCKHHPVSYTPLTVPTNR